MRRKEGKTWDARPITPVRISPCSGALSRRILAQTINSLTLHRFAIWPSHLAQRTSKNAGKGGRAKIRLIVCLRVFGKFGGMMRFSESLRFGGREDNLLS